jgi:ferric iron reductase protein FhuF
VLNIFVPREAEKVEPILSPVSENISLKTDTNGRLAWRNVADSIAYKVGFVADKAALHDV